MRSKLLNIFIIVFIAIATLVLTGCDSKEDKTEDTIKWFIEKHYVADKIALEEFEEYGLIWRIKMFFAKKISFNCPK